MPLSNFAIGDIYSKYKQNTNTGKVDANCTEYWSRHTHAKLYPRTAQNTGQDIPKQSCTHELHRILVKTYPRKVVPAASLTGFFTPKLYPVLRKVNHPVHVNRQVVPA